MLVLGLLGGSQLPCLVDLVNFFVSQADNYVLRLEVSMDHLTHPVHVVKSDQTLSRESSNQRKRYAFIIVSFDDFKKVDTQNLKNHDEVLSVGTMVDERIE